MHIKLRQRMLAILEAAPQEDDENPQDQDQDQDQGAGPAPGGPAAAGPPPAQPPPAQPPPAQPPPAQPAPPAPAQPAPPEEKEKPKKKKPLHPSTNIPCPKGAHWNADTERCEVLPVGIQWDIKKATAASESINEEEDHVRADLKHGVARRLHQRAADKLKMAGFFKLAKHHQKKADSHEKDAAKKDAENAIDPRPPQSFNRRDDYQLDRGRPIKGAFGFRPTWRD